MWVYAYVYILGRNVLEAGGRFSSVRKGIYIIYILGLAPIWRENMHSSYQPVMLFLGWGG